ncbi:MAG: NAD(P)H-hydrate dehydratase [Gemmatimonadaceae bacterium]
MPVRVVSAEESGALDAAAIAAGVPSRALMRVAAFNAATLITERFSAELRRGVTIFTGPGNNGGDGWALSSALDSVGVAVHVREIIASRTTDALAERALAIHTQDGDAPLGGVLVDAMLGTGSTGTLRGAILAATREIADARVNGAKVVALDLPTGLDASTGSANESVDSSIQADFTISFGTCKRGSLITRAACGDIAVLDIGLPASADIDVPTLVDARFVRSSVPRIPPDANKGTRKSVAVVAGAGNMGGAAILAATAALRSGAGLVKIITAAQNIPSVHARLPEALCAPLADANTAIGDWADVVLIGPGLGRDSGTTAFILNVLENWHGPVVVDADALNAFDGDLDKLGSALQDRPAIITPHPGEMARLTKTDIRSVLNRRFDIGLEVARHIGATVLLKGTPTVVSGRDGQRKIVASGTAALATGGSGDALGGMIATLLAQGCSPVVAASCAAWVHGRAAELTPGIRGYRLIDILDRLPQAWSIDADTIHYPMLASLPALA